jgi:hypothetical protein
MGLSGFPCQAGFVMRPESADEEDDELGLGDHAANNPPTRTTPSSATPAL